MAVFEVTAENIDEVRAAIAAADQAAEVTVGMEVETWGITHENGQRGQMTVFCTDEPAKDRAAISFGGPSVWGDWDDARRVLIGDDDAEYNDKGEMIELPTSVFDDAAEAAANFVEACRDEDGELDENITYPEFLQIIVNANAPAWPTFATKLEDEAATTAAWEFWCEQVKGQEWERGQKAVFEIQKREGERAFIDNLNREFGHPERIQSS